MWVNIPASATLKIKEFHDLMNTINASTAEDATVIVGTVIDENMADQLRVTMVATGLGQPVGRAQPKPLTVVKTGTDAGPVEVVDYAQLETPAVLRRRNRESTIEAMRQMGAGNWTVDFSEIDAEGVITKVRGLVDRIDEERERLARSGEAQRKALDEQYDRLLEQLTGRPMGKPQKERDLRKAKAGAVR